MSELAKDMRDMRAFVGKHLQECCVEVIDWTNTSILVDGFVRNAANIIVEHVGDDDLSVVESEIKHQAMKQVAESAMPGLTEFKTKDIIAREGFQKVGYVLQKPGGDYCISSQSAVRWLDSKQMWRLMHEQDGKLFNSRPAPEWDHVLIALQGIDEQETSSPEGWWETSTGAKFGAGRLAALKQLFDTAAEIR